jgi:hypothetical protein
MDFKFDISETINEFSFTKEDEKALANYILDNIVTDWENTITKLIAENQHSTAADYIKSIHTERPDDFTAILGIVPVNKVIGMIEAGSNVIDLKEGFKASSKAHNQGQPNWWLTIPIQHATSDAVVGSVVGQPMPKAVLKASKEKEGKALSNSDLPTPYNEIKTSTFDYKHKASIYEGLVKIDQSDTQKRSGYFTFRRVSDQTDDNAWMLQSKEAKDFVHKAFDPNRMLEIVNEATNDFILSKK